MHRISKRGAHLPATRAQLACLKALAQRTGQTFAYPQTRREASREIERLLKAKPNSRTEVDLERKDIADQLARGPRDAARVRPGEVSGYGSGATWKERS